MRRPFGRRFFANFSTFFNANLFHLDKFLSHEL